MSESARAMDSAYEAGATFGEIRAKYPAEVLALRADLRKELQHREPPVDPTELEEQILKIEKLDEDLRVYAETAKEFEKKVKMQREGRRLVIRGENLEELHAESVRRLERAREEIGRRKYVLQCGAKCMRESNGRARQRERQYLSRKSQSHVLAFFDCYVSGPCMLERVAPVCPGATLRGVPVSSLQRDCAVRIYRVAKRMWDQALADKRFLLALSPLLRRRGLGVKVTADVSQMIDRWMDTYRSQFRKLGYWMAQQRRARINKQVQHRVRVLTRRAREAAPAAGNRRGDEAVLREAAEVGRVAAEAELQEQAREAQAIAEGLDPRVAAAALAAEDGVAEDGDSDDDDGGGAAGPTCVVCLNRFKEGRRDPMVYPACGHTVCSRCYAKAKEYRARGGANVNTAARCETCREPGGAVPLFLSYA